MVFKAGGWFRQENSGGQGPGVSGRLCWGQGACLELEGMFCWRNHMKRRESWSRWAGTGPRAWETHRHRAALRGLGHFLPSAVEHPEPGRHRPCRTQKQHQVGRCGNGCAGVGSAQLWRCLGTQRQTEVAHVMVGLRRSRRCGDVGHVAEPGTDVGCEGREGVSQPQAPAQDDGSQVAPFPEPGMWPGEDKTTP